ncbi:unnamed protein product [Adineta steineri]|uniref:Enoyl reductase (ER) domain-containing protein n=1 Tax=Adineta steineri TaxID=433720 RepID=A0A818UBD9_9BILA|nr:unnamed protein product [Adineta steineri]CAF3696037.1 unnamed protein product [Adineta steineri]
MPLVFLKRSVYTAIKSISEPIYSSPIPSTTTTTTTASGRMQAWIIYYYGNNQQFTISDSVQLPIILSPKDVLIKVSASSINQIDIRRREGYGGKLINAYQSMKAILQFGGSQVDKLEFPLILGRDFCGEIIRKGPNVTKFNIGDKVYGALNVTRQGSFAQYCAAGEDEICLKPNNISDEEAAALPLVSLTSWYAIRKFSGFNEQNALGKRALVIGASGGVGHIATQLFKNLGMETTALCSVDSFDYIRKLGIDDTVNYKQKDWLTELSQKPKYDIIFDTVGPRYYSFELMSPLLNQGGTFVTIITPAFRNVDKYGLISGLSRTAYKAVKQTLYGLSNGINYRWAAYSADGNVLSKIKTLVEQDKLKVKIDSQKFSFEQIPEAISYVENGSAKGKVVIKYSSVL